MEISDFRLVLEFALGLAGFFGAFVLRGVAISLKDLEEKMSELPMIYVLKEDYVGDIREIKDMLKEIYGELRRKQDKVGH
jgi:hypothetical protein